MFIVSLSAILSAFRPSTVTCVLFEWFHLLGYTILLCPTLFKIAAVNDVSSKSMKFRRVDTDGGKLRRYPVFIVIVVFIYLIVWTILDLPSPNENLALDHSGFGNTITVEQTCSSTSGIWHRVTYAWQCLVLISASILAFQSRNVVERMNEVRSRIFHNMNHCVACKADSSS